ncbi:MAG TPA: hypothetical protein VD969_29645 [Symbiobacteriaceae bacterium]|nr:hypothetical protein [Symbiobacteriaceae bacterium]
MNRNWRTITGALLISAGVLAGGAAYAAEKADRPDLKQHLEEKVKEGKLTPGEAEVVEKLHGLRRSYHQKFKAEANAVIEQALKDGKITKEQADRFKAPRKRRMPQGGPVMKQKDRETDNQK